MPEPPGRMARAALPVLTDWLLFLLLAGGLVLLTLRGQNIVSETFLSFEIWFTVAAMYWLVTTALSGAADALERRLAYPA